MKSLKISISLLLSLMLLTGCVGQIMTPYPFVEEKEAETAEPAAQEAPAAAVEEEVPVVFDRQLALDGFQKGGCGGCHVIPGAPGATGVLGPDLSRMGEIAAERLQGKDYNGKARTVAEYMNEALLEPDVYLSPDCSGKPCPKGLMPVSLAEALSEEEFKAVIGYLSALPDVE